MVNQQYHFTLTTHMHQLSPSVVKEKRKKMPLKPYLKDPSMLLCPAAPGVPMTATLMPLSASKA